MLRRVKKDIAGDKLIRKSTNTRTLELAEGATTPETLRQKDRT